MGIPLEFDKTVIILDELKFDWKESALRVITTLWNEGMSKTEIARYFRIKNDEALLVLLHLKRNGIIKDRSGELFESLS